MKKSFEMAGAFIGVIVGAGFASGQEILQFFTSFGWWGVVGTINHLIDSYSLYLIVSAVNILIK